MKMLITKKEFNDLKSRDLVPLECNECHVTFTKPKHYIQCALSKDHHSTYNHCSKKCVGLSERTRKIVTCKNCGKLFEKLPCDIKAEKNDFCNNSCAGTYNIHHRKLDFYKRSKLEIWIEKELKQKYARIDFKFNDREAISSELDIYIPSLKFAVELNGICHYEPIYGKETFERRQNNDERKMLACAEKGISLCVIDTSHQRYFKKENSQKFLKIITDIIDSKMG